jgi:hypothetical protein
MPVVGKYKNGYVVADVMPQFGVPQFLFVVTGILLKLI